MQQEKIMKKQISEFNISASALGAFETCPYKWALLYYYKEAKEKVSVRALLIGIAMHNLLESFYKDHSRIKWNKQWLIDNWEKYYRKQFDESEVRQDEIKEGYKALEKLYLILEKYDWFHSPMEVNGYPGTEYYFKFPFQGNDRYLVNISGKIDLILKRQNQICVIDWKTGKSKQWQANTLYDSAQLILYSAALQKIDNIEEEKLYLVYFYTDEVKEFEVTNDHFEHVKSKINHLIDMFDRKIFKRQKGFHCRFCEFQKLCKEKEGIGYITSLKEKGGNVYNI